ncbi:MAG TPA: M67 family metallopeptidase [Candidatus Acidoferrum sp.]|jgi:proteasome lid subunit RPN8/RPN11
MSESPNLLINEALVEKIRQHGAESYPNECCGALLGCDADAEAIPARAAREVLEIFPLVNRREDSPRNRFFVTAEDAHDADKAAQGQGLDLIGWYHSHPDHPARPSEYDREHAWPWYSYVIVSVRNGNPWDMKSWRLQDDRAAFVPEEVEIRNQAKA